MKNTKITIVTVTYNANDLIEQTIQSVINQTYSNIEYIVIDGASTDGTLEKIYRYKNHISIFISEKDNGIYHAMNKAIKVATGEWIHFLNAGDYFADLNVIDNVFSTDDNNIYDFIYGQHIWKNGESSHLVKTRPLDLMWQHICFSHQSLFTKTKLLKERPFNTQYKIVCDYENYYYRYIEGDAFKELDYPIAFFSAGGYSDVNFFKRTYERWHVVKKSRKASPFFHLYYIRIIIKHYLSCLKKKFSCQTKKH